MYFQLHIPFLHDLTDRQQIKYILQIKHFIYVEEEQF